MRHSISFDPLAGMQMAKRRRQPLVSSTANSTSPSVSDDTSKVGGLSGDLQIQTLDDASPEGRALPGYRGR